LIVAAVHRIINPYEPAFGCRPMTSEASRHLVVSHYHLRPGGVRRVIETALPPVIARGGFSSVVLAAGEAPDPVWLQRLRAALGGVPLTVEVRPEFLYWSELATNSGGPAGRWDTECTALLGRADGRTVLWVHNLALGRNAPLAAAWARAAERTGAVMLSHHHDFFFDNRWIRWPEMVASGAGDLATAAQAVFPGGARTVHLAINRADHALLAAGFGRRAMWLPNPVTPPRHRAGEEVAARAWLAARTGFHGPCWLLPCRLLRRKNIAEAVLLARWLQPGARVVTTGGPTSVDEDACAARLHAAARAGGWPLDLAVLAGVADAPPVSALIAAAEAVVLTSLQEGFGLPYLEAAAAGRPLVARSLPNVLPDLLSLGLRAPLVYNDVMVPHGLFDVHRERDHQRRLHRRWRAVLPATVRDLAGEPMLLGGSGDTVPFSRLTMTGQEEVMCRATADLRTALGAANPEVDAWRGAGPPWPDAGFAAGAAGALSPAQFAEAFEAAVAAADRDTPPPAGAPEKVMRAFVADRLRGENLYPMLFAPET